MTGANTSTPTVTVDTSTDFFLVVTSSHGCSDTDFVHVQVSGIASFSVMPGQATMCVGDTLLLSASGGLTYLWSPNYNISDVNVNNPLVYPDTPVVYSVIITNPLCNAEDTLYVPVELAPQAIVTVSQKEEINCDRASTELTADGALKYLWIPGTYLDNTTSAHVITTPLQNITYMVVGENLYGCRDTASIFVDINATGEGKIFLPDAFTPNGDSKNDCWRIRTTLQFSQYELSVFNRWGERVFQANNPDDCWDGRHKGTLQPLGSYYYYYKVRTIGCGDFSGKGDVHLIR
jgi:gliding motility-associated-like protein